MFELALELQKHAPVNVRYEQLVAVQTVADAQKDILIQALRSAFPSVDYFSEASVDSAITNHTRVVVKCVSCTYVSNASFVADSMQSSNTGESIKLSFSVKVSDRTERWNIDISQPKIKYTIAAARPISSGHEIADGDLQIVRCEAQLCGTQSFGKFESEEKARSEMLELQGATSQTTIDEGRTVDKSQFSRQALIKPMDSVRLTLNTDSGLQIRTRGRALSSGYRGGRVRIEINDENQNQSGVRKTKVIEAIVTGASEAKYEY